jgi:putative copper export protein
MYQINVWLHLIMATVWVGGLIYTMAVVIPFALSLSKAERQPILRGLARRFRKIGWTAIALLFITGFVNFYYRTAGLNALARQAENGANPGLSPVEQFMKWLGIKLGLIIVMVGLMLFHDITSLRDAKRNEGKPGTAPHNRAGSIAAALATLLAIVILYVSVRLVRG